MGFYLPKEIALGTPWADYDKFKSETKMRSRIYLGCVPKASNDNNICELRYNFKATDPAAKFIVEPSNYRPTETTSQFVHIKCCFNNKYWCRNGPNSQEIVARGDKPVEDQNTWECTVFQVMKVGKEDDRSKVELWTMQLRDYNRPYLPERQDRVVYLANYNYDTTLTTDNRTQRKALSMVIDYGDLVMLPRFLTFKRSDDDNYLTGSSGSNLLTFTAKEIATRGLVNEVFQTGDNKVRFKNLVTNKFWVSFYNQIKAEADENDRTFDDQYKDFEVVKLGKGVVALRTLWNRKYCIRDGNSLSPNSGDIVRAAELQVVEPIRKREIEVIYRTKELRILNETPEMVGHNSVINRIDAEGDLTLGRSNEYTESSTWTNTFGVMLGMELKFEAKVPIIGPGTEVTFKSELKYEHQWAKTEERKNTVTSSYTTKVRPKANTKTTLRLVATKATCDLPFTYLVRDTLFYTNEKQTTEWKDGVFNGVQYHGFHYETWEEPIYNPSQKSKVKDDVATLNKDLFIQQANLRVPN